METFAMFYQKLTHTCGIKSSKGPREYSLKLSIVVQYSYALLKSLFLHFPFISIRIIIVTSKNLEMCIKRSIDHFLTPSIRITNPLTAATYLYLSIIKYAMHLYFQ
ncbi:hypothetical protein T4B_79 [Trichinella pseudospiralis]|uniref:Uncharacterized protein n=1 Tax=Trichinella pseudospiralis TaxID=6337 RepID=A0A0V1JJY8_TRIPS|nr:hypothetical protein T4B_79 [Trichinella pseudospiralis]KRZ35314.1 hypothetical protein T4C_5907 [Trichinella pseudospiralis]